MRNVALLSSMIVMAACAINPPVQSSSVRPVASTARYTPVQSVSLDTLSTVLWVKRGDSTLARLLRLGQTGNRDIRAAEARLSAARAARRLSALDFLPTVTTSASFTRQRLSGAQMPGAPDAFRDQRLWDAGADVRWELDVFGRMRQNVTARTAFESAAGEDVRAMQLSIIAELARTYYDLRGSQNQLAVAQRNADNQRRTLRITTDRLEAGRGSALDKERAIAQLNSTLASVPLLEARVSSALSRITTLVGHVPSELSNALRTLAPVPSLPERPDTIALARALAARPDVRSAERYLAGQRALAGAARAEYLPRVSINAGVGVNANAFDSLSGSRASRYRFGPTISWPALDLVRVKTYVDAANARTEEQRARYDQIVLEATSEIEIATAVFDQSRARLSYLQAAADASERGAELAQLRFTNGAADFLEVLDSERTLLAAQDQLARGQTDVVTAFVALYKAVGGDWGK